MDDETEVAWPQHDDPTLAGAWLDQVEALWREFNIDSVAPLGQRPGRSPRYRADAERVESLLPDLRSHVVG